MNQGVPTCKSSGTNRTFFSRAVSFRLSKQPSLVYPVAVTLPGSLGSPVALLAGEAQATRNIGAMTASTTKKRLMTTTKSLGTDQIADVNGPQRTRRGPLGEALDYPRRSAFELTEIRRIVGEMQEGCQETFQGDHHSLRGSRSAGNNA